MSSISNRFRKTFNYQLSAISNQLTFPFRFQLSAISLPFLLSLILFLFHSNAFSAQVMLAWDPNIEPDLAGYKMYYGTSSGNYPNIVDVGKYTNCTVSDLEEGKTYYFATTAYDTYGYESGFSNEVSHFTPKTDTDADGIPDDWEMEHFGTLDRDGTGDFDGDGISDLDEYLNGTDPALSNAPTIPAIFSPADQSEVTVLQPELVIENSTDPDGDDITYDFELYADEAMTTLVAHQENVAETAQTTSWTAAEELNDNAWYYWRARATDGKGFSQWGYGRFFVNTDNDPPGGFNISSPQDGSQVDVLTPTLEVTNSADVDQDTLTYTFEVYADSSMTSLVASVTGIPEGEKGTTSWGVDLALNDNTWYFWRAITADEHGATSETALTSFFVNTLNDAPSPPSINLPADGSEVAVQDIALIVNNSVDADGDTLTYRFELDTVNTFDSPDKQIASEVFEGEETTSWPVAGLSDNTWYFWRVRAGDGAAQSAWVQGSFFVNTVNDLPSLPTLRNPGEGAWVETLSPKLAINPSMDPDNDRLIYRFEIYADSQFTQLVASGESDVPEWIVSAELSDNTWYYWRAQAEDEHGATSAWMNTAAFFTDTNGIDDAPAIVLLEPSGVLLTNADSILIRWEDSDPDSDARISLYYDTDTAGEDGTLIEEEISEDPDGENDAYRWNIGEMVDGTYYVYTTISDGSTSETRYSTGAITIDRTPSTVVATPAGGSYDSMQSITLTVDESAEIYYTLDGTEPTLSGLLYENSPIKISETTTLRFMAIDEAGNSSAVVSETYSITITPNIAPNAAAGDDINIYPGDTAYLDGSASDDPDSSPQAMTYAWHFIQLPESSVLTDSDIADAHTSSPYFVPDVDGTYTLELTVEDGEASDTDQVLVFCSAMPLVDLDGDGISDDDEINIYSTDPYNADTDLDGINDGDELHYWGDNWDIDDDGDGLVNLLDWDADGDGFSDGTEIHYNFDPADPYSKFQAPLLEINEVSVDHNWIRVELNKSFFDPVVVAKPLSHNEEDPAVVRIRDVDTTGFWIRIQEWDYLDDLNGTHLAETVSYIVMERGSYILNDGTRVEAGRLETDKTSSFGTVSFSHPFQDAPVVMAAISSFNESDTVTGRIRNVSTQGFEFCMQEQELNAQSHATETVSYVAWEPSLGTVDGLTFEIGKTEDVVRHRFHTIQFGQAFMTNPMFLADMQTADSSDTANVRWQNKDAYSVEVKIHEEQSRNKETNHTTEVVGYMVFSLID